MTAGHERREGGHAHDHDAGQLLSVEGYRDLILSRLEPLPPVELGLHEAFGRVLAVEVASPRDLPSFPSSAMDGFAVRAGDAAGATPASPVALRVAGRVQMGRRPDVAVGEGEAARIATGAPVPQGADAVVPIEECVIEDRRVLVLHEPTPGRYVRPAGQDVGAGDVLVPAGRRLLGPELGLLSSAGLATVRVHPRARVFLASTGDELVPPGEEAGYGQVHDANGLTLYGALLEADAEPLAGGIVGDDPQALRKAILAAQADAFVTSGGVSVGERDPVKGAFLGRGEVEFHRVAIQPGMPQAFGLVDGRPFFGLPGNPVSVFVSFEVFVRPAILRMMGRRDLFRPEVVARLQAALPGLARRTRYARVAVRRMDDRWVAEPTGGAQSNLLSTVSRANGLAIVPAGVEAVRSGEECRVMLFRDPEDWG